MVASGSRWRGSPFNWMRMPAFSPDSTTVAACSGATCLPLHFRETIRAIRCRIVGACRGLLMKAKIRQSLLAAALALAALPTVVQAADSPFTQTVFFGDSLTDGGYFRPVLIQMVGRTAAIIGKFTTNPATSGRNTGRLRQQCSAGLDRQRHRHPDPAAGNNWAVGGARTAPAPSVALSRHAVADRAIPRYPGCRPPCRSGRAVFRVGRRQRHVWCEPAQAQAIIGAAVTTAQVGLVGALTQAGAQYILVPTLPDLGLTPDARRWRGRRWRRARRWRIPTTPRCSAAWPRPPAGVIPMDTFHFLQEVVANPRLRDFPMPPARPA